MAHVQPPTPAKKKAEGATAAPPSSTRGRVEPADVASRAYELWLESGCKHGNDQEHWFRAEQELRARRAAR